jgi:protein-S-isoprenylcysteine O-methyltransferase Ste14
MRNRGLSRPGLNALICVAMVLGGALSIWTGASDMNALGYETNWTAMRIALGILAVVLGSVFLFNFVWGMRVVGAFKRGDGVIARWTVAPAAFDQFRAFDRTLKGTAEDNDYRVPKVTPPAGVDVAFSADGVLVGDTFFGLASSGLIRFNGVRLRQSSPPCLEFGTVMTQAVAQPTMRVYNWQGILRVPIADDAHDVAAKVQRHYEDVIARRIIVNPQFWRTRIKIGLVGAVVFIAIAAVGFSLSDMNEELAQAPLIMAVAGTMFAIGGLILALLAWLFEMRQRNG